MASNKISIWDRTVQNHNPPGSTQTALAITRRAQEEIERFGYSGTIAAEEFVGISRDSFVILQLEGGLPDVILPGNDEYGDDDFFSQQENYNNDDFPLRPENKMPYGAEEFVDYETLVEFHFNNLFLTIPGERIGDAEYGIGIKRYLFDGRDKVNELLSNIAYQIKRYLPGIKLYNLYYNFHTTEIENDTISISLEYGIQNSERILVYQQNFS